MVPRCGAVLSPVEIREQCGCGGGGAGPFGSGVGRLEPASKVSLGGWPRRPARGTQARVRQRASTSNVDVLRASFRSLEPSSEALQELGHLVHQITDQHSSAEDRQVAGFTRLCSRCPALVALPGYRCRAARGCAAWCSSCCACLFDSTPRRTLPTPAPANGGCLDPGRESSSPSCSLPMIPG